MASRLRGRHWLVRRAGLSLLPKGNRRCTVLPSDALITPVPSADVWVGLERPPAFPAMADHRPPSLLTSHPLWVSVVFFFSRCIYLIMYFLSRFVFIYYEIKVYMKYNELFFKEENNVCFWATFRPLSGSSSGQAHKKMTASLNSHRASSLLQVRFRNELLLFSDSFYTPGSSPSPRYGCLHSTGT